LYVAKLNALNLWPEESVGEVYFLKPYLHFEQKEDTKKKRKEK